MPDTSSGRWSADVDVVHQLMVELVPAGDVTRLREAAGGGWKLQAAEPPGEPQPSYLFFDLHFSDSANNTFRQKVNCLELGILNTS